jgi:hypothetical protein
MMKSKNKILTCESCGNQADTLVMVKGLMVCIFCESKVRTPLS